MVTSNFILDFIEKNSALQQLTVWNSVRVCIRMFVYT